MTLNNECYAWGENTNYQLNLNYNNEIYRHPTLVSLPNIKLTYISCCDYTTSSLTSDGLLFFTSSPNRQNYAMMINSITEPVNFMVFSGYSFVFITKSGKYYKWGYDFETDDYRILPVQFSLPNDERIAVDVKTWTKETHKFLSEHDKKIVETLLILSLKKENPNLVFTETLFYLLPKEIQLEVLSQLEIE